MTKVEDMDGKDCIRVLGALMHVPSSARPGPASLQALGVRLSAGLADISNNDTWLLFEILYSCLWTLSCFHARRIQSWQTGT